MVDSFRPERRPASVRTRPRAPRPGRESDRAEGLRVEVRVAVLTVWGFFGALGGGFVLSGFRSASLALGLAGYALLIAAAVAHLIVDRVYGVDLAAGEVAAGLGIFALALLGFVARWLLTPNYEPTRVALGLIGSAVGVGGAFTYVATRFGLRHAFSMFHSRAGGRAASVRPGRDARR